LPKDDYIKILERFSGNPEYLTLNELNHLFCDNKKGECANWIIQKSNKATSPSFWSFNKKK
jgi:hypothetical protein